MYASIHGPLKVRCRVRASARVVVLLEVGLEGSVAGAGRVRLVSKRCASVSNKIVIVVGHAVSATPDTPADDGNTAQKDGTTDAAHDTPDDLLVAVAKAAAALAIAILGQRKLGGQGGARSDDVGLLAAGCYRNILAVANGRVDGDERADRCRNERCGLDDGRGD